MAFRRELATLLLLSFLLGFLSSFGEGDLSLNYYSESCPRAEDIVKEEVEKLYHKHGNTAVSWVRNLFHDCMVKSCDASLLLKTTNSIISEQTSQRSFGMRNFKYITTIRDALERECPNTVSCADIVALSAREAVLWEVLYSRNDQETPMVIDNMYYKNLLKNRGLLLVDQQLTSDPTTTPFVELMAANNSYFHERFATALLLLSENNPLTTAQGEIRKDCRFVNAD